MLERLKDTPPDALLALIAQFAADEREDKIDLGVGVYRTDDGATPVFGAIKAAEQRLWEEQDSKSYLGPEGDRNRRCRPKRSSRRAWKRKNRNCT